MEREEFMERAENAKNITELKDLYWEMNETACDMDEVVHQLLSFASVIGFNHGFELGKILGQCKGQNTAIYAEGNSL